MASVMASVLPAVQLCCHSQFSAARYPGVRRQPSVMKAGGGSSSLQLVGTVQQARAHHAAKWRFAAQAVPSGDEQAAAGDEAGESANAAGAASKDEAEAAEPVVESASSYQEGPSKRSNQILALASCAVAVSLFLAPRLISAGPDLGQLAAAAVPYEEALSNGRPTVLEFYADWCEVCREMARDVYGVEQEYKDQVNFVMLNVDNTKWEQELDEFGVEGIPHFTFLDGQGNEEGNIVGRMPKTFLVENLRALLQGDPNLPHTRLVGRFSDAATSKPKGSPQDPRAHS